MVKISPLFRSREDSWDEIVKSSQLATIHHSIKYRNFLAGFLSDCEEHYLVAEDDENIIGILPLFVRNGNLGKVVNSLPFFGSHGSIIWNEKISLNLEIKTESLRFFLDYISQNIGFESLTFVESLFSENLLNRTSKDAPILSERIGQFSYLQDFHLTSVNSTSLLKCFSPKKQWDILKAKKNNFVVTRENSFKSFENLFNIHSRNMKFVGGKSKSIEVFSSLFLNFRENEDYVLYLAWNGATPIAGLCLLFFGDQVEYFVPAVLPEYRSSQVLNQLIFQGMLDALIEKKVNLWNWGGTWKSQEGVYNFKKSWGASEKRYFYQTWTTENFINSKLEVEQLIQEYPYFYCYPFDLIS